MRSALSVILLSFVLVSGPHADAGYKGRLIRGVWQDSWSETLEESLSQSSLLEHKEDQIEKLCPGYRRNSGKRDLFWRQLMISLGWKESLHGPRNYVHFNGGTNDGLYQINPKLRRAYGCTGFDLFDPHQNIRCAVKMADHLVRRFGSFLSGAKGGMAAYWQPLRGTSRYNRANRAFILDHVKAACRTDDIAFHSRTDFVGSQALLASGEADLTYNTIEDLGLREEELDSDNELPLDTEYGPETFLFGSDSRLLILPNEF
ncbi:MAG: hypothetical protein AB7G93_07750 [Bdellovibrionales bacterium]